MAEVTFSFRQQTKIMVLSGTESEVAVQQELCSAFGLPVNTEISGIKNGNTGRVYSFAEVISQPGIVANSLALILIGPLSPTTLKKRSTAVENLFQYIFHECRQGGEFRYFEYFTLRVLYNRKSSSLTAASNLLLDNDLEALNKHLHTLVAQVRGSTTVKMDILRLITTNMQKNKELSYAHAAVLLSLIQNEDGLVCSAFMAFEQDDNLGALKDSLLRILLLTVKPDYVNPQVLSSAQSQQSRNRGSWRSSQITLDISTVLEQLSLAEVLLYTLFELGVLNESQTSSLVRQLSEEPSQLQKFIALTEAPNAPLRDISIYTPFLQGSAEEPSHASHGLHELLHTEYPTEQITEQLLQLEREGALSKLEYATLFRRCVNRSLVVHHCYDELVKDHDTDGFRRNLQAYLRVYATLTPPQAQISNPFHVAILQEVIAMHALSESEVQWVVAEYCNGNEVVVNSFSVCEETNDVAGLVAMLRTLIRMMGKYQLVEEAMGFFDVLLGEMLESGVLSISQHGVLQAMVHESNQVLLELYQEYQRSQDFEGLLGALLVLSSAGQKENEGVEELSEDDRTLPTRDESIQILEGIEELGSDVKSQAEKLLSEGNIDVVFAISEYVRDRDKSKLIEDIQTIVRGGIT